MAPTGDLDHNQACALTGNRTGDLLVHSPALNPLRHTNEGSFDILFLKKDFFKLIFRDRGRKGEREGEKHREIY